MSARPPRWTVALVAALLSVPAMAEEKNDSLALPPVEEIGGDVLRAGVIRFNPKRKTVTFPATVNQRGGLLEYFLVGTGGKTHESLLATSIEPSHLHTIMLLLGAKAPVPESASAPTGTITASALANAPAFEGDPVAISVSWKKDGLDQHGPAEDLIRNAKTRKPMRRGPWTYNGSRVFEGQFLAQAEKSFIALVNDPDALINNPRPGHDDDQIWSPNTKEIMPVDTPVEVTITLLSNVPPPASHHEKKPAPSPLPRRPRVHD